MLYTYTQIPQQPQPTNHTYLRPQNTLSIHNNFDHHGHDSRAAGEKNTAFTFDKVYDVSGLKNTKVHHHDIVIPADAAPGDYHLMVWCTDAAGNQTEVARNIVLSADGGTETEHDHDHE